MNFFSHKNLKGTSSHEVPWRFHRGQSECICNFSLKSPACLEMDCPTSTSHLCQVEFQRNRRREKCAVPTDCPFDPAVVCQKNFDKSISKTRFPFKTSVTCSDGCRKQTVEVFRIKIIICYTPCDLSYEYLPQKGV